jgi:ABC-2 type transport system ATP-binding protein
MYAIETDELRRTYKNRDRKTETIALDRVSLQIEEGEVRGLLGPNGAGKTTLVKVLSTVLLPTNGTASVLGFDVVRDVAQVRPMIGIVLGGDRGLYWGLTGRENLEYWAALYRVPSRTASEKVDALLERVGLGERADELVEGYSRGMKQRLHLARGLIGESRVVFLDEPTTGLDPIAAREFRQLIKELKAEGRTILLTTHDMSEAEEVCDRVAFIDHGRLLAVESPRTLARLIAENERIDFDGPEEVAEKLRSLPSTTSVTVSTTGSYRVETIDQEGTREALRVLVEEGVTSLRTSAPNLEDVYVQLIGDRGLRV